MRKLTGLLAVALAVLVGCGGDSPDERGPVDMTVYLPDLERMFDTTYEGVVVDGESEVECSVAGETFTMPLEIVSEMRCTYYDEDHEEVRETPCTHAMDADIDVAGQLMIGAAVDVAVTGGANVRRVHYSDEVENENWLKAEFDDDVPLQRLEPPCYEAPPYPRFEVFWWSRRHSEEDAGQAEWEMCLLEVE
jgi:hypothetical protein